MNNTITNIARLQRLANELGIHATSITPGAHLGYGAHEIVVDWNGEEEIFATPADAEHALREAAN